MSNWVVSAGASGYGSGVVVRREFLGWDRPLLGRVIEWLLQRRDELPGMLVVVPTAQAGRRLRQALAESGGCLAPRVLTPGRLMAGGGSAAESAEVLAWVEVLEGVGDWDAYAAAFPVAPGQGEASGWGLALAKSLSRLRAALRENAWTLRTAARVMGGSVEAERWRDLAELEGEVEHLLSGWGMESRSRAIERLARSGVEERGGVVLAGVVDLPQALRRALEGCDVTCLIAAPAAEADAFDEFGRPLAAEWNERELAWPETGEVVLAADPRQQAQEAVRVAAAAGTESDQLALGSADDETAGELERAFTRVGWVAYNPAGGGVSPEATWFSAWRAFLLRPDAAAAIDLLGMPATGALVGGRRAQRVRALSAARDEWLARDQADLERVGALERRDPEGILLARETLELLGKWRSGFMGAEFVAAMERLLGRIDREQEMSGVREWLESMGELIPGLRRGAGFWIELMVSSLAAGSVEPPAGRVLDVQGWLELLHEPGRHLVVCGMNEGKVPAAAGTDTWLPEGTRVMLGLTTDEGRAARDAYLLRAMIAARRGEGRVDLLLAKSSAGGDALLPSRLLLAAGAGELPARVKRLFAELEPPDAGLDWVADWKWRPREVEMKRRLGVTAFRDYLACPFRFYLKHVVRMRAADPERVEWDARDFGNVAHDLLEMWGRDEEAREFSKGEAIEEWLHEELERMVAARFGGEVPLAVRIQVDRLRQRLSWFARVQACEAAGGWRIEEVEKKYAIEVGGFTVVGKVDRIERHSDGRRRVIDYKTYGKRKKVEADHRTGMSARTVLPAHLEGVDEVRFETAPGKFKRWHNLQVPLYAAELGGIDEVGYFVIGAAESEVGIEMWDGFGAADTESALRCAEWVLGQLSEGRFWPPAAKVKYDDCSVLAMGRPLEEVVEAGGLAG